MLFGGTNMGDEIGKFSNNFQYWEKYKNRPERMMKLGMHLRIGDHPGRLQTLYMEHKTGRKLSC